MKMKGYDEYKDWIAESTVVIPYVCFLIGIVCFVSIFWLMVAYFVVAVKFGTGIFEQRRLLKKLSKTPAPKPQAKAETIQSIEEESETKTNESGTQNGSEGKENEGGVNGNTDGQPQSSADNTGNAAVDEPKPAVTRLTVKKYTEVDYVDFIMLMLTIMQKMFYVLIVFLLLTILLHLNLLMLDSVLRSTNVTTVPSEVYTPKERIKCCVCEYAKNVDKFEGPASLNFPVNNVAKLTDLDSDDGFDESGAEFEEPDFANGPFSKGAKPTIPGSVYGT